MVTTTQTNAGQNVIAFPFALGQRVRLVDADCAGRIKQMCVSVSGREYQVAYFHEDKGRRVEWLGEDELERI